MASREIVELIPSGASFAFANGDEFGAEFAPGHRAIPFLERDGVYWGEPPDDETAVREIERLRKSGLGFIVLVARTLQRHAGLPGVELRLHSEEQPACSIRPESRSRRQAIAGRECGVRAIGSKRRRATR